MGREYSSTAGKTIPSAMKKWLYKWNGLYMRNNLVAFYYPNASDI